MNGRVYGSLLEGIAYLYLYTQCILYIIIYIPVHNHPEVDRIWDENMDFPKDSHFCDYVLKLSYSIYSRMATYIYIYT